MDGSAPACRRTIFASGVLMLAARSFARVDPVFSLPSQFGADNLARLQRELQVREADLERYGREHPGLSNKEVVRGFLITNQRSGDFHLSGAAAPPLFFKFSDWRGKVPCIVVSFGCNNNIVFNSATMQIEQID